MNLIKKKRVYGFALNVVQKQISNLIVERL